ncbi:hypothetical protein K439DRAFT_1303197, partial [Ramaria rubella]
HMAFVDTLRSDGYACTIDHTFLCKQKFDKKVHAVDFQPGDVVQVYDEKLDKSYAVANKLAPRWSGPMRIMSR